MTSTATHPPRSLPETWPDRLPLLVPLWAIVYVIAQLIWMVTGTTVRFSPTVAYPSWMLLGLALVALLAAGAAAGASHRDVLGPRSVTVTLAVTIPVLAVGMVGLPVHVVSWAAGAGVTDPVALAQQLLHATGVAVLAPTALVHRRRSRSLCIRCGQRHGPLGGGGPAAPPTAGRRTRVLAYVSLLGIVPWAATKTVWGLGHDFLGVSAQGWHATHAGAPPVIRVLAEHGIDITVLAAGVGAVLTLVLLHSRGRATTRWLLVPPAFIGGLGLTLYGVFLLAYAPLTGAGVLARPEVSAPFTSVSGVVWMIFFGGLVFGGLGGGLLIAAHSYAERTRPSCEVAR